MIFKILAQPQSNLKLTLTMLGFNCAQPESMIAVIFVAQPNKTRLIATLLTSVQLGPSFLLIIMKHSVCLPPTELLIC